MKKSFVAAVLLSVFVFSSVFAMDLRKTADLEEAGTLYRQGLDYWNGTGDSLNIPEAYITLSMATTLQQDKSVNALLTIIVKYLTTDEIQSANDEIARRLTAMRKR